MNRNKIRTLVAAGAAAAVLGIAGFAWAAFSQETSSSAVAAEAETFAPVVVAGTPADTTLWPGQSTTVTLTVDNSANDVAVVVTRVDAIPLTDADITTTDPADRAWCRSKLILTGIASTSVPIASEGSAPVVLTNGIQLLGDADNRCQGMQFSTKWKVWVSTATS